MADEAVKIGATTPITMGSGGPPPDKKIFGVSLATVLNNIDCTGAGAGACCMLPTMPGYTPWARLSSPMAGLGRGTYFVPQIGDEVLVAFNHGDVREPYVLGSCWNTIDRPPALAPTDPVTTRKIRTPLGHELSFDEALQSVTLTLQHLVHRDAGPDEGAAEHAAGQRDHRQGRRRDHQGRHQDHARRAGDRDQGHSRCSACAAAAPRSSRPPPPRSSRARWSRSTEASRHARRRPPARSHRPSRPGGAGLAHRPDRKPARRPRERQARLPAAAAGRAASAEPARQGLGHRADQRPAGGAAGATAAGCGAPDR